MFSGTRLNNIIVGIWLLIMSDNLELLNNRIISCTKCDRLVEYCGEISRIKKRMYITDNYWGKPVPGFGDPNAQVLIVGLAPAAHGANRTGRMFTGDKSGAWLFSALGRFGFSNSEKSLQRGDGLKLRNVYITSVVHCAPPKNKPSKEEMDTCNLYLQQEIELLTNLKVVVTLGKIAFDGYYKSLKNMGYDLKANGMRPTFSHASSFRTPDNKTLISSFHPSQQNTQTGKLTTEMFDNVFLKVTQALK